MRLMRIVIAVAGVLALDASRVGWAGERPGQGQERGPAPAAGDIKPLQIEHAVAASDFHIQGRLAVIAPDGSAAAYTVCDPRRVVVTPGAENATLGTTNAAYHSMGCDVWLSPLDGGTATNLTRTAPSLATASAKPVKKDAAETKPASAKDKTADPAGSGNNWGPAWSPDGTLLAFYSDRSGAPHVWVWERATQKLRRLQEAATRTWMGFETPAWTPDSKRLIVKLFPQGMTQEQIENRPGTAAGTGTGAATSSASSDIVSGPAASGSTVTVLRSGTQAAAAPGKEAQTKEATPLSNHLLADLGVIDVATGRVVRRLATKVRTTTYRLSPDGRTLAFLDDRPQVEQQTVRHQALMTVGVDAGEPRELVPVVRQEFSGAISWSPDSRWIAYVHDADPPKDKAQRITAPGGATARADLFIVAAGTASGTGVAEPRRFTGVPERTFSSDFLPPLWDDASAAVYALGGKQIWRGDVTALTMTAIKTEGDVEIKRLLAAGDGRRVWTADGGGLMVITTNDRTKREGFARIDPATGAATRLLEADTRVDNLFSQPAVAADGRRVVYPAEGSDRPSDLYVAASDFAAPRRLTTINPQLADYTFGRSRLIDFRSADGEPLRATLLLPAGYVEGRRYPLVTWVYASDMGSKSPNRFGMVGYGAYNLHMLTTRGYAVMWPDIPVRTGSPMQDLMKAVMPALDRAIELGIADPDRLAVMGQSNGGYSTLSLLVQTNRFKAAVMNAGFGDLTGFYGSMSDNGAGVWIPWLEGRGGAMGVPPWEAPQRYLQNSPIYFLDRLQTPLIIQAGGSDRAIVPYSDQVFVGLKRLNKDVTYLRYGGESHVLAAAPNLIDYWNRVIAFYDRHLEAPAPPSTK